MDNEKRRPLCTLHKHMQDAYHGTLVGCTMLSRILTDHSPYVPLQVLYYLVQEKCWILYTNTYTLPEKNISCLFCSQQLIDMSFIRKSGKQSSRKTSQKIGGHLINKIIWETWTEWKKHFIDYNHVHSMRTCHHLMILPNSTRIIPPELNITRRSTSIAHQPNLS